MAFFLRLQWSPEQIAAKVAVSHERVYLHVYANKAADASVTTLGWMDAAKMQMDKLYFGRIGTCVGVYTPGLEQPHGSMWGLSAQRTFLWKGMSITPEFGYTRYAQDASLVVGQRNSLRAGVAVAVGL